MNKLLVVMLAVCLVSVHAFVKRDTAPAAQPNALDNLVNEIKALGDKVSKGFSDAVDPEKIKNDFSALVDQVSQLVKPKEAPKA